LEQQIEVDLVDLGLGVHQIVVDLVDHQRGVLVLGLEDLQILLGVELTHLLEDLYTYIKNK
jgi:hypothetical protein